MTTTTTPLKFEVKQFTSANPNRFSTEASDLRLRPGQWPVSFVVDGIGKEGEPFTLKEILAHGHHVYRQDSSAAEICIWND